MSFSLEFFEQKNKERGIREIENAVSDRQRLFAEELRNFWFNRFETVIEHLSICEIDDTYVDDGEAKLPLDAEAKEMIEKTKKLIEMMKSKTSARLWIDSKRYKTLDNTNEPDIAGFIAHIKNYKEKPSISDVDFESLKKAIDLI